jgi:hypothetical protein
VIQRHVSPVIGNVDKVARPLRTRQGNIAVHHGVGLLGRHARVGSIPGWHDFPFLDSHVQDVKGGIVPMHGGTRLVAAKKDLSIIVSKRQHEQYVNPFIKNPRHATPRNTQVETYLPGNVMVMIHEFGMEPFSHFAPSTLLVVHVTVLVGWKQVDKVLYNSNNSEITTTTTTNPKSGRIKMQSTANGKTIANESGGPSNSFYTTHTHTQHTTTHKVLLTLLTSSSGCQACKMGVFGGRSGHCCPASIWAMVMGSSHDS